MISRHFLVLVCVAILASTGTWLPHVSVNITPWEVKYNQTTPSTPDVLTFYYPWYGTPNVSGQWVHWDGVGHNPDNIVGDWRDISAVLLPLRFPLPLFWFLRH